MKVVKKIQQWKRVSDFKKLINKARQELQRERHGLSNEREYRSSWIAEWVKNSSKERDYIEAEATTHYMDLCTLEVYDILSRCLTYIYHKASSIFNSDNQWMPYQFSVAISTLIYAAPSYKWLKALQKLISFFANNLKHLESAYFSLKRVNQQVKEDLNLESVPDSIVQRLIDVCCDENKGLRFRLDYTESESTESESEDGTSTSNSSDGYSTDDSYLSLRHDQSHTINPQPEKEQIMHESYSVSSYSSDGHVLVESSDEHSKSGSAWSSSDENSNSYSSSTDVKQKQTEIKFFAEYEGMNKDKCSMSLAQKREVGKCNELIKNLWREIKLEKKDINLYKDSVMDHIGELKRKGNDQRAYMEAEAEDLYKELCKWEAYNDIYQYSLHLYTNLPSIFNGRKGLSAKSLEAIAGLNFAASRCSVLTSLQSLSSILAKKFGFLKSQFVSQDLKNSMMLEVVSSEFVNRLVEEAGKDCSPHFFHPQLIDDIKDMYEERIFIYEDNERMNV